MLETQDGDEALRILARSSKPVHLVLCDAVMPRMSGRELGRRLRQRYPGLPILYMSGYTGEDVRDRGLLDAEAPFIAKPFSSEALAARVRELLDGTRSDR